MKNTTKAKHSTLISVSKKLATTASAAAAFAGVSNANADVICVDGPIEISLFDGDGFSVGWDIDGANGDDFTFSLRSSSFFFSNYPTSRSSNFYARIDMFSNDGRGMVENSNGVAALAAGDEVGPTLAGGYNWVTGGRSVFRSDFFSRIVYTYSGGIQSSSNFAGTAFGVDFDTNFGVNLVGFRFENGVGDLHYGYAEMNFTGGGVVIERWYYEDVANTSITIPGIPEPNSLALLALGAGGLMTLRKKREASAA